MIKTITMNRPGTTEKHRVVNDSHPVNAPVQPVYNWRARRKLLIIISIVIIIILASGSALAVKWLTAGTHKSNADKQTTNTSTTQTATQQAISIDLSITSPANHSTTTQSFANITGSATSGSKVTINGMTANMNDQAFSAVVNLELGDNTITAIATGSNGGRATQSITITRTQSAAENPSITLTGGYETLQAQITWFTANINAGNGYYVLRSLNTQPSYPSDLVGTNASGNLSFRQSLPLDGTTYHYQVCQIAANGSCGIYSNVLTIAAQVASTGEILTNLAVSGTHVTWDMGYGGYKGYGFLLLWSTSPDPTYPSANTVYRNDGSAQNAIANASVINHDFVSGTQYYVGACENLGGKCGSYSNTVIVTAP